MTSANPFDELLDLTRRIGITVRHVRLGGNGGGLVKFKNQRQLFIDLDAGPIDQLEQTAKALTGIPELQTVFIRPDLRQLIEHWSALPAAGDSVPPIPADPASGKPPEQSPTPLSTQ